MGDVSGESDHAPFAFRAGVPVANVRFADAALAAATANSSSAYPASHTVYDNLVLYEKMLDPEYGLLRVCSQLMAHVTRRLAGGPWRLVGGRLRLVWGPLRARIPDHRPAHCHRHPDSRAETASHPDPRRGAEAR